MNTEPSRCRVVLVQPHIAGNLGATARVMRNMGLTELVLVNPEADPADRQARQQATQGECILEQARILHDFSDAVADCALVVGTSARVGGLVRRQSVAAPEEIMPRVADSLRAGNSAALVFGPEHRGLTNEEVTRCHFLVSIPADPVYPVLNLAQAVGVCLYELRRACMAESPTQGLGHESASFADQELMFERLRQALERIHFLYGPKADALMHALRHLLGRARPTTMEVKILLGLARQLNWYAENCTSNSTPREI